MRILNPFDELLLGLWLLAAADNSAMGFPRLMPEGQVFIGRLLNAEILAPPIRETLQSGALRRSKASDRVFLCGIDERRIFVVGGYKRVGQFFSAWVKNEALLALKVGAATAPGPFATMVGSTSLSTAKPN